ncbi:hypothetical protein GBA52_023810 [Prunus armeniaca]|nr:hypothetical protein GBA52_023810 [Prunus armeniaca]
MRAESFNAAFSSGVRTIQRPLSSSIFGVTKPKLIAAAPSKSSRFTRISIRCAVHFRPCIDIHKSAAEYAKMYKEDGLTGGHDWYNLGGLQVGGGINSDNSLRYIEEGASHVIVTSYVFNNGKMDLERLKDLVSVVGKERLVLDLSCRKREGKYAIVTDRWQKFSDVYLDEEILDFLANYADEFLVHGVDVEGKKLGIDEELVALLGKHSPIPVTYAGGVTGMGDLERIKVAGAGTCGCYCWQRFGCLWGQLVIQTSLLNQVWHYKHPGRDRDQTVS